LRDDPFVPNYRRQGHCGQLGWSIGRNQLLSGSCGPSGCCTPLLYSLGGSVGGGEAVAAGQGVGVGVAQDLLALGEGGCVLGDPCKCLLFP
jgi:hypothetical protein